MQDTALNWITNHQRLSHSVFWLNHGPQSEGTDLLGFKIHLRYFRPACFCVFRLVIKVSERFAVNGNMIHGFSRRTSLAFYSDFILCADVISAYITWAQIRMSRPRAVHVSNKCPSFPLLWHAFCENAYRVIPSALCARGKWSEQEHQSVRIISGTAESFSDKFSVNSLYSFTVHVAITHI
jgi:hypothetical protein